MVIMTQSDVRRIHHLQNSKFLGRPLLPLILMGTCDRPRPPLAFINDDSIEHSGNYITNAARGYPKLSEHNIGNRPSDSKDSTRLKRYIRAVWCPRPASCGDLLKTVLQANKYLSTGFSSLDNLLDGGILTNEITEFVGKSAVGKTQLCLSVCASVLCQNSTDCVLYLDTAGNFTISGLLFFLRKLSSTVVEKNQLDSLRRIRCCAVTSVADLIDVLVEIRTWTATFHPSSSYLAHQINDSCFHELRSFCANLKLIVLDSLALPFLPFMGLLPKLAKAELAIVTAELRKILRLKPCAIIVVNHAKTCPQSNLGVPDSIGCLGAAWSHVPHKRLMLRRANLDPDCHLQIHVDLAKISDKPVCGSGIVHKSCVIFLKT